MGARTAKAEPCSDNLRVIVDLHVICNSLKYVDFKASIAKIGITPESCVVLVSIVQQNSEVIVNVLQLTGLNMWRQNTGWIV